MPRKQRFKPSRKPQPMTEASQNPATDRTRSMGGDASQEPGGREPLRHEVHADGVEREGREG